MLRSDEQFISDYLEGDEEALDSLIDKYLPDAYNFAFRLTGDLSVAEDVAQESFIKAWKKIRSYRPGNNFRGWLFSIVHNTAIDYLRKKKELAFSSFENANGENIFVESLQDAGLGPNELLARAEDAKFVAAILAQLDVRYKEVLTLRYEDDLTFKEIGEMLQRPLHTVKSQHRRALISLRRIVYP